MRTIRPATTDAFVKVDVAIGFLRSARTLLESADCPQALEKVRAAIKSAEGARRHVQHRESRAALAKLEA
jgi:hypothetical protein